jgi:hypothetical protein
VSNNIIQNQIAEENPSAEYGNPARQASGYGMTTSVPLDLDWLKLNGGLPKTYISPFPQVAGPYMPQVWAAIYQSYLDWTGIINPIQLAIANKQQISVGFIQGLVTNSGVSIKISNVVVVPEAWSPFQF